eukprot:g3663.t1
MRMKFLVRQRKRHPFQVFSATGAFDTKMRICCRVRKPAGARHLAYWREDNSGAGRFAKHLKRGVYEVQNLAAAFIPNARVAEDYPQRVHGAPLPHWNRATAVEFDEELTLLEFVTAEALRTWQVNDDHDFGGSSQCSLSWHSAPRSQMEGEGYRTFTRKTQREMAGSDEQKQPERDSWTDPLFAPRDREEDEEYMGKKWRPAREDAEEEKRQEELMQAALDAAEEQERARRGGGEERLGYCIFQGELRQIPAEFRKPDWWGSRLRRGDPKDKRVETTTVENEELRLLGQDEHMSKGFCSFRTPTTDVLLDLSSYSELALRVRTDGRPYMLNIWVESILPAKQYVVRFPEEAARDWHEKFIKFDDLTQTVNGRPTERQNPINLRKIAAMGISINDKPGPFKLEIQWVKATVPSPPKFVWLDQCS